MRVASRIVLIATLSFAATAHASVVIFSSTRSVRAVASNAEGVPGQRGDFQTTDLAGQFVTSAEETQPTIFEAQGVFQYAHAEISSFVGAHSASMQGFLTAQDNASVGQFGYAGAGAGCQLMVRVDENTPWQFSAHEIRLGNGNLTSSLFTIVRQGTPLYTGGFSDASGVLEPGEYIVAIGVIAGHGGHGVGTGTVEYDATFVIPTSPLSGMVCGVYLFALRRPRRSTSSSL